MDQVLDVFSTPSQSLPKANDFPAWQINTSILKRLQSIKWSSSAYERKTYSTGTCYPVYYRTYSREGSLKEEGLLWSNINVSDINLCEASLIDWSAYGTLPRVKDWLLPTLLEALSICNDLIVSLLPPKTKEYESNPEDSHSTDCRGCSTYLVGNPYWRPDKLTKPICFVVDNTNWSIRFSLLSTPLVHALRLGSKDLLQAI